MAACEVTKRSLWGATPARICSSTTNWEATVRLSVLDAIREGMWDYEPRSIDSGEFSSTRAMPGTRDKLDVLARRAAQGLPLWHDEDRSAYDDGMDRPLAQTGPTVPASSRHV